MKGKTIAFTGHRPDKLNGYDPKDNKALLWYIQKEIVDHIDQGYTNFINGLALGIDQWCALIVLKLKEKYPNIRLISAIPCTGHPNKWKAKDKETWGHIVANSDELYLVTSGAYTKQCMQVRNQFIVDKADKILAVWGGTSGGTANCVKYAKSKLKPILILNPNEYP